MKSKQSKQEKHVLERQEEYQLRVVLWKKIQDKKQSRVSWISHDLQTMKRFCLWSRQEEKTASLLVGKHNYQTVALFCPKQQLHLTGLSHNPKYLLIFRALVLSDILTPQRVEETSSPNTPKLLHKLWSGSGAFWAYFCFLLESSAWEPLDLQDQESLLRTVK